MGHESGIDFHVSCQDLFFRVRITVPVFNIPVFSRKNRVFRQDAELFLLLKNPFPVFVPALVKGAPVPVYILLRRMVGRMISPEREIAEEGFVWIIGLQVSDIFDCPVSNVLAQVIPLVRSLRLVNKLISAHKIRVKLACTCP